MSPDIFASDILQLCRLIDYLSMIDAKNERQSNTVIYDALGYICKCLNTVEFIENSQVQSSLVMLVDVISLRCTNSKTITIFVD